METATKTDAAQQILDLWFYRSDVFVTQFYSDKLGRGGYTKVCAVHPTWKREPCEHKAEGLKCGKCQHFKALPINSNIMKGHLDGAITLGAYQLGIDGTTAKWGCLDFDANGTCTDDELRDAALLAQMSLEKLSISSCFEASGGNGWRCHLWSFFALPVPAIKLRVIYQAALKDVGLNEKPFIECFPKQARALNGYGNLVKVPFGIHRKTKRRSTFLDNNLDPISVDAALEMIEPIDSAVLDFVIDAKGLTLEDSSSVQARPAKDFEHPSSSMEKILSKCWFFREIERRHVVGESETVDYHDWWNYVLMLCRFGDAGINRILNISKLDDRFEFEATINLVNYLRQNGYHAPSCRRLKEGPGNIHCPLEPLECGAI